MEHGKTTDNRLHYPAPGQATATPAQKRGALPHATGKDKGRGRTAQRQQSVRTACDAANGILKCRFLPKFKGAVQPDATGESDFYCALNLLALHYSIPLMPTRHLGFPYNKALALWEVQQQLAMLPESITLSAEVSSASIEQLSATETCVTGALYYIPLIPLYHMQRDAKRKACTQLLLSACGYLCHIAGVPNYRDEDSYLYAHYEIMQEWLEDDPESYTPEEFSRNVSEVHAAKTIGDIVSRRMWNPCHLNCYAIRLENFRAKDSFEQECYEVAKELYELWQSYSHRSIYNHPGAAQHYFEDEQDEGDSEPFTIIRVQEYVSFAATTEGWLYKRIQENINSEFNECGTMEQPEITRIFGRNSPTNPESLDFDNRLFDAIDNLCYLLNNYSYENPE